MRTIPLTKGYEAIVDDDDYLFLSQWKWHALIGSNVYAERCERPSGENIKHVLMHRVVNNTPNGFDTDHINGDGLDNRRANLRTVTRNQNMRNRRPNKTGSSKYKGVYWHKQHKKWAASIQVDGKRHHIGLFQTEIDASNAYAEKAFELFGEYNKEIIYV